MRIIGGTHGGRVIRTPSNLPVRPTTDLAKESLFNILNNRIDFEGLRILDLFSGTGNISYEFASRGALEVVAVENNFKCCHFIKTTAVSFGFSQVQVVKSDVFSFLSGEMLPFDIIFSDAPFESGNLEDIPRLVFENGLLLKEGWLIIEHEPRKNFSGFQYFCERREYGRVNFSFFCL